MKTLQINLRSKTIVLSIAFLVIFLGAIETVLRIERITTRLAAPSFGSEHRQFEIQISRLNAVYQKQESIDCIFIGDSLVWLDMDPTKFMEGYQEISGGEIKCFNFGIAALPALGVYEVTKILVEEYNPQLIIYGLHANSLVVSQDEKDTRIVLDTPWVRYKSGKMDLVGWFYEHSYFVRYLKVLNQLILLERDALVNELGTSTNQLLGSDSKNGQRIDVNTPPSIDNPADANGFEKYQRYHIFPENIAGIQGIANLTDDDTQVFMVMMPVDKSFYAFFENGEQDYAHITEVIHATLDKTGTVLLKPDGKLSLLDSDWWDYSHLNSTGAEKFSYWLGVKIGEAYFQADVSEPVSSGK
jgi:hypothetical protein